MSDKLSRGDSIIIRKDDEDPYGSEMSTLAAALFAVGFDLVSKKGFTHIVSGDEENLKHSVTWLWKPGKVKFSPDFEEEEITFEEFERRFSDPTWIAANVHHPISHMWAFLQKSRELAETFDRLGPCVTIKRGDMTAIVPIDTPEEEIDALFDELRQQLKK